MRIEELSPVGAERSTGLILHWRDRLLFALVPMEQWQDTPHGKVAHLVGIGGHLEPGEGWVQAVRREAREEADVCVDLCAPPSTWFLSDDGTVQDVTASLDWPEQPRPSFIWHANLRFGQPPNEWSRDLVNAVFEAILPDDVEPCPAAEMPAILAITLSQLRQIAAHPLPLGDLVDSGTIWESFPIPRTTLVTPMGSALWYQVWLRHSGCRSASPPSPVE